MKIFRKFLPSTGASAGIKTVYSTKKKNIDCSLQRMISLQDGYYSRL
jgi:hypothetical protein